MLDYVKAHGMGSLSSVIRRPSAASIISEPTTWIPFKFWLLLPLGDMPDSCLKKNKKKKIFFFGGGIFFTNIFCFR